MESVPTKYLEDLEKKVEQLQAEVERLKADLRVAWLYLQLQKTPDTRMLEILSEALEDE